MLKILAKKIRFLPKLKPERAFDVVRTNTSAYGMLYSVSTWDINFGRPVITVSPLIGRHQTI